jgi:septal ring factor EnvC (AmiA/AmiB activator)
MILMNVLIYLQNVSREKISIERITYGMLDVTKEMNGRTPVVDLSNLLKLSDWISGAYAFQQFGNAYKIAELMKTEDPSVAERLKRFSDLLNLNHIASIREEAQNLSAIKNQHYSSKIPEMVLNPILKDFINEFSNATTDSSFQFRLAQWQFEHHNYCPAFLTLQESIITYVCEQSGYNSNDYDNREEVKKKISKGDGIDNTLRKTFKSIKNIRNSLAHSRKSGQSYTQMIKTLQDSINILKNIIH